MDEQKTPAEILQGAHERLAVLAEQGDSAAAIDLWARILTTEGNMYRDAVASENWKAAAAAGLGALIASASLLPLRDEFAPAHAILDALQNLIIERGSHPILRNTAKIRGLGKGGSVEREQVAAIALCCWLFLEEWQHPSPAATVGAALRAAGYSVQDDTIRSWRNRQLDRDLIGVQPVHLLDDLKRDPRAAQVQSIAGAETFVREILRQAIENRPLLQGR